MFNEKKIMQCLYIMPICLGLAACGGGGGGADPSAYQATTAGQGSTVSSAETPVSQGTIRYTQYEPTNTLMSDKTFLTSQVNSAINFDPTSKRGSIQFPVLGATELISTSDAYATVAWTGPFLTGTYKFNGNVLMGCNASAISDADKTQVFVSSSLSRIKDGFVDDLAGTTYDLIDCSIVQQGKVETLKINSDGSLFMSTTNSTIQKNHAFDFLNPEKYQAITIANANFKTDGFYFGNAFRYGVNGVFRYVIVIQTNAGYLGNGSKYHYLLAIQR